MRYEEITAAMPTRFRLAMVGTHPLLMHNSRLCDPIDPIVQDMKKITKKRTKTIDDHAELGRLEWMGGIYFHPEMGVVIPGLNIHTCLTEGAKLSKSGQKVKRGVFIDDIFVPLIYDGPRELDALVADKNFTYRDSRKVQASRVMRTRPRFSKWKLVTTGVVEEEILDLGDLQDIARTAGMTGLGDSRPAFGRFFAQVDKIDDEAERAGA